jgi:hypothetical protein
MLALLATTVWVLAMVWTARVSLDELTAACASRPQFWDQRLPSFLVLAGFLLWSAAMAPSVVALLVTLARFPGHEPLLAPLAAQVRRAAASRYRVYWLAAAAITVGVLVRLTVLVLGW